MGNKYIGYRSYLVAATWTFVKTFLKCVSFLQLPLNDSIPPELLAKYNPYVLPIHCTAKVKQLILLMKCVVCRICLKDCPGSSNITASFDQTLESYLLLVLKDCDDFWLVP